MSRMHSEATDRPIGIFDSGVGGLTVLREVARALPHQSIIYLGDSARLPYGTKSADTVSRYAVQAAEHLIGRGIQMLVIACNTATAAALPLLRERFSIPILGVIEPGAEAAVRATRSGLIGVIATEGTIRSRAYTQAIQALSSSVRVTEVACPLFVALAEEGWANTHVAREVAEVYLEPLIDAGIDTLVLGCTHYPLLRHTIQDVVGPAITIVDSAETTAAAVSTRFKKEGMHGAVGKPEHHFLVTDAAERFERIAAEFLEQPVLSLELVDLSDGSASAAKDSVRKQ